MEIKSLLKMCHWKHLFDIFYNFLPEQSTSNWPSEHWQLPSNPQVPLPLQVVLGLQNANTNEKWVYQLLNLRRMKIILLTCTISWEELTVTFTGTIFSACPMTTTIGCSFTCNCQGWKRKQAVTYNFECSRMTFLKLSYQNVEDLSILVNKSYESYWLWNWGFEKSMKWTRFGRIRKFKHFQFLRYINVIYLKGFTSNK